MEEKESLSKKYFDDVYGQNEDPWNFETSTYEDEKYTTTVNALPKHYKHAFEIGCSIGVLTQKLLQKADKILAVDPSELALAKAKLRLKDNSHVVFEQMMVPQKFPLETFDLIVLSEVGYYLKMDDFKILSKKITDHLEQYGQLIAVHWTPFVHDYPLTGDQVHEYLLSLAGNNNPLKHLLGKRAENYRLDLFEKR